MPMFDCVIVDFKNNKNNINYLLRKFPYAKVYPFVDSFHLMIRKLCKSIKTEYFWFLSSKIDYTNFNFDFIPEQHERYQIHTWANPKQDEGDTFLIPKNFTQDIQFLRDYKNINYHKYNNNYDFDLDVVRYDLQNVIDNLPKEKKFMAKYVKYCEQESNETVYPSYWEDLKIYKHNNNFYIPYHAIESIKTQLYDYPFIHTVSDQSHKDCFDVAFISNGEPFENENFAKIRTHIRTKKLKNKLHWIKGIKGRTNAYKKAAETVGTEYFFAVFAKSVVRDDFLFDYTVDRALCKRHRIFHSYLKEVDLDYGTFNINLYNKSLCLKTSDDNILDFTLSQKHEVIPIIASDSLLAPDNYTAWKNAFREVSKLELWQEQKPTVENRFRLKRWLETKNKWLRKGAEDGKNFTIQSKYDEQTILQTYTWDFCRAKFKSLYPDETYY